MDGDFKTACRDASPVAEGTVDPSTIARTECYDDQRTEYWAVMRCASSADCADDEICCGVVTPHWEWTSNQCASIRGRSGVAAGLLPGPCPGDEACLTSATCKTPGTVCVATGPTQMGHCKLPSDGGTGACKSVAECLPGERCEDYTASGHPLCTGGLEPHPNCRVDDDCTKYCLVPSKCASDAAYPDLGECQCPHRP
ncbi:MAG: hypothetical protein U0414_25105 [Polyangiaceae bacterium]